MRVYSNVFVQEETEDVLGIELVPQRNADSNAEALLYVYEGGNSDPGVPLSGQIANSRLRVQGTWVEHLIEYPSKREIGQTHFVKIAGTLDTTMFHDEVTIEGMEEQAKTRLRHVKEFGPARRGTRPKN
jgi:hypothetical protein